MKKRITLPVLFLLLTLNMLAQIRLPRLFSDHAVLQRQKPIPVWGWAKPKETVRVSFANQIQKTVADTAGKWQVQFAAMEAGGPYTLTINATSGTATRSDILLGDVWLCSGQSNMEWTVKQANNFVEESKNADFPQIRHFGVAHEVALLPVTNLPSGEWKLCTPKNAADFTAIGFFFAREIFQKTAVPIGILHSSWGGSQIEGWISKEAMQQSEDLRDYADNLPKNWEDADLRLERRIKAKLLGSPDANPTLEDERAYLAPDYDFSNWISAEPMWQWDWKGIWAWRGNGFMGKMVDIPADMTDQITTLGLAEIFSQNEIYINGKLAVAGAFKGPRRFLIPAGTWKPGLNKLMVKMNKAIDPEWFGLGLMGTANDLFVSTETQRISLAGNDWKLMPSFAEPHTFAHSSNNVGTSIYNAMIAPLVQFPLRGVLWYQGESNAGRAYQYRRVFPLMIEDWRRRWKDNLPFYFVQLSSYGAYQNSNQGSDWAELREAQTLTLSLPNTGMAVTTDIGNPQDIHPTNKQDVAKRLAAIALKSLYGQEVLPSGPMYESVEFANDEATISFKYAGAGLMAKDKFGYLKGFEIAGEDRVFYYAKAEIKDGKVVVKHPKGLAPAAVRYAWANAPEDANLFNLKGFPACPFRTDAWEGITVKERFE
jgi:sialate O-acetylesterase